MDATIRPQIGLHDDKLALQGYLPNEKQKECLSGTVGADDEASACSAVGYPIDILQDGLYLALPADLNMLQSEAGHDASPERLDDRIAVAGSNRLLLGQGLCVLE
jgi:hypothetical protein